MLLQTPYHIQAHCSNMPVVSCLCCWEQRNQANLGIKSMKRLKIQVNVQALKCTYQLQLGAVKENCAAMSL